MRINNLFRSRLAFSVLGAFYFMSLYVANFALGWPSVKSGMMRSEGFVDLYYVVSFTELCSIFAVTFPVSESKGSFGSDCSSFNYGSVLTLLPPMSFNQNDVSSLAVLLGLCLSLAFGILVSSFSRSKRRLLVAAVFLSAPPTMLLFERANFDIVIIFGLLLSALLYSLHRQWGGFFILAVLSLLKFYTLPLLWFCLIRYHKGPLRNYLGLPIGLLVSLIVAWDLLRIESLPGEGPAQFGFPVLLHYLEFAGVASSTNNLVGLAIGIVFPLLIAAVLLGVRSFDLGHPLAKFGAEVTSRSSFASLSFWFSAITLVSCYFAGLNYDYRLTLLGISGSILILQLPNLKMMILPGVILSLSLWASAGFGSSVASQLGTELGRTLFGGLQLAGDFGVMVCVGVLLSLMLTNFQASLRHTVENRFSARPVALGSGERP